ncbi:hypothetical protein [Rhizobium sp. BR 314]|uniref:hypothetical protein n=1 Tax=Rhizobium sp. BR 314 TaxID=3040013 RepID=UPI0039BFDF67
MPFRGNTQGDHAPSESAEGIDALVTLAAANPGKALVLSYVVQIAADGCAVWNILENGEIEVRFNSGEIFILAETTILRLA